MGQRLYPNIPKSNPLPSPLTPQYVFVRSLQGSPYRSPDDGKTWDSLRDKLTAPGVSADRTRVQQILVSRAASERVSPRLSLPYPPPPRFRLRSRASGRSCGCRPAAATRLRSSTSPASSTCSSTQPSRIGSSRRALTGTAVRAPSGPPPPLPTPQLFLSLDFGATWKKLTDRVRAFAWADGSNPALKKETIFATMYDDGAAPAEYKDWDSNSHFVISQDFFSSADRIVPFGNKFSVQDGFVMVAALAPDDAAEIQIFASADAGASFRRAEFPAHLPLNVRVRLWQR
jgi:hypothetical protein